MSVTIDTEAPANTIIARGPKLRQNRRITDSVSAMPQPRWPIITTSISGIPAEFWHKFKHTAKERGLTHREAAEEAIRDLSAAVASGQEVHWEPLKTGAPHSLRAHEERWAEVAALVEKSEYRQSVVIMTALKRWIDKGTA